MTAQNAVTLWPRRWTLRTGGGRTIERWPRAIEAALTRWREACGRSSPLRPISVLHGGGWATRSLKKDDTTRRRTRGVAPDPRASLIERLQALRPTSPASSYPATQPLAWLELLWCRETPKAHAKSSNHSPLPHLRSGRRSVYSVKRTHDWAVMRTACAWWRMPIVRRLMRRTPIRWWINWLESHGTVRSCCSRPRPSTSPTTHRGKSICWSARSSSTPRILQCFMNWVVSCGISDATQKRSSCSSATRS